MTNFATNRQKLDAIQEIVGNLFGQAGLNTTTVNALFLIDSICDEPLFAAKDETKAWND